MKRINTFIVSGLLSVALSNVAFAEEKSGFFAGAHVGVSLLGVSTYINGNKQNAFSQNRPTFNAGLQVGYQQFFMPMLGIRGYLSYDASINTRFSKLDRRVGFHNIALNADLLVNFLNTDSYSFGVFAGFGLAYGIAAMSGDAPIGFKYNGFNIPINVGLAASFGNNKVELGAKIQTLAAKYSDSTVNGQIAFNPHTIYLGYSYIF